MRLLHYFQVPCHVSRQVRSTWVHSMLFCMALRQRRRDYQGEAGRPEAVCSDGRPADSDSSNTESRIFHVVWVLARMLSLAALTTWQTTAVFAAPIDKYLGMPVAKVQFTSEDFIDVTALEQAVAVAVGKPLDASDVRQSISTLYQTHEFSQIEADATLGDSGLAITF